MIVCVIPMVCRGVSSRVFQHTAQEHMSKHLKMQSILGLFAVFLVCSPSTVSGKSPRTENYSAERQRRWEPTLKTEC